MIETENSAEKVKRKPIACDADCRNAKPEAEDYGRPAGEGLRLFIKANGSKLWQYRFRVGGNPGIYSIGAYPEIGLAAAREQMRAAKVLVKQGVNPTHSRKAERLAKQVQGENTFKAISQQWLAKKKVNWAESTYKQCSKVFDADVFPKIGKMAIRDVKPPHILSIVKGVEERGAETIAILILQWIGSIFQYAGANLLVDSNPVSVLSGVVTKPITKHKTPMEKAEIARLAEELASYGGNPETVVAVKMLLLTFVRTKEIRMAKWAEFNLDAGVWIVPEGTMKKRERHLVPLSKQVVGMLRELQLLTGSNKQGYLFPNTRRPSGCMSATTVNRALEYMGFNGKNLERRFSGHSFRTTASTILNELGYRGEVIEMQQARKERDKSRASYNHADYWEERVRMMQAWSDLMDAYADPDSNVVALKRGA